MSDGPAHGLLGPNSLADLVETPGYFDRKVLNFSYSPAEDVVAIAGRNNLFIYNATVSSDGKD